MFSTTRMYAYRYSISISRTSVYLGRNTCSVKSASTIYSPLYSISRDVIEASRLETNSVSVAGRSAASTTSSRALRGRLSTSFSRYRESRMVQRLQLVWTWIYTCDTKRWKGEKTQRRKRRGAFSGPNCEHGRRRVTALRPPIDTPRWSDNNNLYMLDYTPR